MGAVLQTAIHTVELCEIPDPVPDADTGLVRVRQAGICGSDLHPYHERPEPETVPRGHEILSNLFILSSP